MKTIYLDREEKTREIGEKLGKLLFPGSVICLIGDLGAGKTTMTQSLAKSLEVDDYITSPTFTIVNEYEGRLPLYHFDVYRLEDVDEFYAIGGDEYFSKGICIIEWGELISDALPSDFVHISFEKSDVDDNSRVLHITTYGSRFDDFFKDLIN